MKLKMLSTNDRPRHQHVCPGCGVETFGASLPLQSPEKDPYGNLIGTDGFQCCAFHSYQCWLKYRKERNLD